VVLVSSEPNLLICVDRADGREKWRKEISAAELADPAERSAAQEYKPKDTGMAAATPITDGSLVYMALANGIVQAVDLAGKTKWTVFIDAKQTTAYGRSSSPILAGGKLIVHMTHLYAFDPASGKQAWVNTDARCAYGTPATLRT